MERKYPVKIERVIDADTLVLNVDVGYRMTFTDAFRLARINAPEMRTQEGKDAKTWLTNFLHESEKAGKTFHIICTKHGKYRWVAEIYVKGGIFDNQNINDLIVKAGHAIYKEY